MKTFMIDDIEFCIDTRAGTERDRSTENRFILVKNQPSLDFYRDWKLERPRTIMEVGLFQGGSLVLLDKLFKPDRIVGLELAKTPIEPLESYRASRPQMRTYYGRSQDGVGTLMAARENFNDGIDLVVDDASHLYEQTKKTFEMLFPLVSAGGHYVIEDWAWAHLPGRQHEESVWFSKPAMSNIALELMIMAAAYGAIESVHVQKELICVKRGRGKLPSDPFDFSGVLRGRTMPRI